MRGLAATVVPAVAVAVVIGPRLRSSRIYESEPTSNVNDAQ